MKNLLERHFPNESREVCVKFESSDLVEIVIVNSLS